MKLESELQDLILKDLRSYGGWCTSFKIMKASENGFPDIFFSMVITGAVFIETKREKGKAEALQKSRIKKLNQTGCKAIVCNTWERWIEIKHMLGIYDKSLFC